MNRLAHVVKGNVIAVGEHVFLQMSESALDAVKPRGIAGTAGETDVVAPRPRNDFGVFCAKRLSRTIRIQPVSGGECP